MSEEVAQKDGPPVRVRLLGEELVVFRDTRGRLGVVDERCPHRRASLALGRNENCGLRCLYHGWKIDVEGNIVDKPSEPHACVPGPANRTRAYPSREAGGFVWVWMGPATDMRQIERVHLLVGRSFRATFWQTVWKIYLPAMRSPIANGVRLGLGVAVIGTLLAETKLSNQGLGYLVIQAYARFDMAGAV